MLFFFFSSRRRHTRCSRDWSSDVCSSDLRPEPSTTLRGFADRPLSRKSRMDLRHFRLAKPLDLFRSEERREGKSVDLGGRRVIKKQKRKSRKATGIDEENETMEQQAVYAT